jgi:L-2-hydroxyglutarate oxidase
VEGGAGVRAQACDRNGGLLDDFSIVEDPKVINILNAFWSLEFLLKFHFLV